MGELTIAKSAGFCFGVTRAVNMVYEAIEKENVPIYTYGPIIHNDEVEKKMKKNGTIVLLTATPQTVYERVKGSHNRPLLEKNMNPQYIEQLMEARRPKYEAAADIIVKTDGRTAKEICQEIKERLEINDNTK